MVGENADLVVVWPRWPAMVGENADLVVHAVTMDVG